MPIWPLYSCFDAKIMLQIVQMLKCPEAQRFKCQSNVLKGSNAKRHVSPFLLLKTLYFIMEAPSNNHVATLLHKTIKRNKDKQKKKKKKKTHTQMHTRKKKK